jgi:HlyD family secretion protein
VVRGGSAEQPPPLPKAVRVRVGITDGTNTEIVEGELAEGDQVVVSSSGGAQATPTARPQTPGGGMRRMF